MSGEAGQDPVAQVRDWLGQRGVEVEVQSDQAGTGTGEATSVSPYRRRQTSRTRAARGAAPTAGPVGDPSVDEYDEPAADPAAELDADAATGPGAATDADPEGTARTIVLRKLAAHARTRAELAKALAAKNVPTEASESVLDRMEDVGLVDDAAFARDWVESRQQRRHLSRSALRRELTAKGVDRDEVDAALEQVEPGDELHAARDLARRKARTTVGLERQVRYRRLAGVLARRGFSGSVVTQVLAETLAEDPG